MMESDYDQQQSALNRRCCTLSVSCAVFVIFVAVLAIAGGIFSIEALRTLGLGPVGMRVITGICFAGLGTGLFCLNKDRSGYVRIVAPVVFVISALSLMDSFSSQDALAPMGLSTISPPIAASFILLSTAMFLLTTKAYYYGFCQLLTILSFASSFIVIIGYAYGAIDLVEYYLFTPPAVNTTLSVFVLAFGLLLANPQQGIMKVFTSAQRGGQVGRKLLFLSLFMILFFGLAIRYGVPQQLGARLDLIIMAIAVTAGMITLVWGTSKQMISADREKATVFASLQRSENEARSLGQRLEMIFDSAPMSVVMLDRNYRCLIASKRWLKQFGLKSIDAIGKNLYDIFPRTPKKWKEIHRQAMSGTFFPSYDEKFTLESGIVLWLRIEVRPWYDFGRIAGITIFSEDITESKKAQDEVKESESKFRAFFSQAAVGIAEVSPSGDWITVNDKVCEITGYTREELLKKTFQSITHPDDLDTDLENVKKILDGEIKDYSLEKRYFRKNGSIVWIYLTVSLVRDLDGNPKNFISIIQDINAKKTIEEELRKSREELETRVNERTEHLRRSEQALLAANQALDKKAKELARSNADLEQFAYVASHDLREPLRVVTNYAQLIERRYKDQLDESANKSINYMVDGANRMQQLIGDLLSYSRAGRGEVLFETTNTESVLRQVLIGLKPMITENGATVTNDPLPTLTANALQIGQLFQNLIANGIKFHRDESPHIHISAKLQDGEWIFSVQDNGIGIEPQYANRIFVIFQRLHSREKYPGTGIGLAICKKIVERHGGRIWIESKVGEGSTFFFAIPNDLQITKIKRPLPSAEIS